MKDFTRPKGRLRSLSFHARLVYSVFLAFTVVALLLTVWLTDVIVGVDLHGLAEYYAGITDAPEPAPEATAGDTGGPVLDLPMDEELVPSPEPMSVHKLLEVTHFHLFSMPVYLLILSHLFMLSRMGDGAKTTWIGLASVSTAAHIAAPWVARSAAAGSGWVYGLSGAGLFVSYAVMCLWPLVEMWLPAPARAAKRP